MAMKTDFQKWGNSLAIRIPRAFAQELALGVGVEAELEIRSDRLIIIPARKKRYKLRSLLARVKKSNHHSEVGWGKPAGREVW